MTGLQLSKYMGQHGSILIGHGSITIPVVVRDARKSYGRVDLLLSPRDGQGEAWVDVLRVNLKGRE